MATVHANIAEISHLDSALTETVNSGRGFFMPLANRDCWTTACLCMLNRRRRTLWPSLSSVLLQKLTQPANRDTLCSEEPGYGSPFTCYLSRVQRADICVSGSKMSTVADKKSSKKEFTVDFLIKQVNLTILFYELLFFMSKNQPICFQSTKLPSQLNQGLSIKV
jgi:hypothetical protein